MDFGQASFQSQDKLGAILTAAGRSQSTDEDTGNVLEELTEFRSEASSASPPQTSFLRPPENQLNAAPLHRQLRTGHLWVQVWLPPAELEDWDPSMRNGGGVS